MCVHWVNNCSFLFTEAYLEEYRSFQTGSLPSSKRVENAISKYSRIKSFLYFLSRGKSELCSWLFLHDIERIQNYVSDLQSGSHTITTTNCYMKNIHQFMVYFSETPAEASLLTKTQIIGVVRAVKASTTGLSKGVFLHQIRVKADKLQHLISRDSLYMCQRLATDRIPRILGTHIAA